MTDLPTPVPTGSLRATSLNAARRQAAVETLDGGKVVDVLVVGGGVTGAGVALDAASRGLSVALLEAQDLAFGTSRFSSKLVHGGLRYLAHGEVGLAHESAVERGVLMTRTAPHLVRALPQLVPLHPAVSRRNELITLAGLHAGDVLRRAAGTPSAVLPGPRRVPGVEALALAPGLRRAGLRGGLLSFDGQLVDDARLVIALARTAAGFGAEVVTRARVEALTGSGAEAVDTVTGRRFSVRAKAVVNATGVWADRLVPSISLRPSRGSHLVLDGAELGVYGTALTVPVPGELNRFVLLLPQADGRVYLGLTDEPVTGPVPDVPEVPESDVDFLLEIAATVLERPLGREHVLGCYAGLRPLIDQPGGDGKTADLSRKHAVLTSADGVITVVGGKLTTYRRMAADAVDAVLRQGRLSAGPCRTADVPLVGAGGPRQLATVDAEQRLLSRYGTEAPRVAALADLDPDLAQPITPGLPVTAAEVVWAVRHEGALDAGDILDRRTRIGLVDADREVALPAVTEVVRRARNALES